MNRTVGCGAVFAALLMSVASCSTQQPGVAQPATDGWSEANTASSAPPSSSASPDPCSLLPADAAQQLQLGQGRPSSLSREGARDCEWNAGGFATRITVFDGVSYDKPVPGQAATPVTIDGVSRRMLQRDAPGGNCAISLETSQTSSVDVYGIARGDRQRACELSKLVTRAVEPQLPKN